MSFKHIFVFAVVLLCAQYSLGNVINTKESEDQTHRSILAILKKKLKAEDRSDTSFENSLDERGKLMALMIGELFAMTDLSLTPAKNVFKNVIADVGDLNNSDGTPYSFLVDIKDLVEKIEKNEEKHDEKVIGNIELFHVLVKIMNKFDDDESEENGENEENEKKKISTTQDDKFSESLIKNGYEAFDTEFKKHFLAFVEKMYKAALNYWNTLSDDEKVEKKKFGDWLTQMKEEQDEEKRCLLVYHIFELLK